MKRIFVPTQSARDWRRLLAKPDLHWKSGRSAMSAAACWEAASDRFPAEIEDAFERTPGTALASLELLLAVPEWKVDLPGGTRASQTDVLAIARNEHGLVVVAVEAKVDEPFGPALSEKRADPSEGQSARLEYLHRTLGLTALLPDSIRYQLLHRTASAIIAAQAFHAATAVMVVQSFSPESRWHDDFLAFVRALGGVPSDRGAVEIPGLTEPKLFLAWCRGGDQHRLADLSTLA